MCGRYVSARNDHELKLFYAVQHRVGEELAPSWNVAPTQTVRIIRDHQDDGQVVRELRNARWGLLPAWAKDRKMGSRLINARSETVTEKPAFRSAARRRRCVVPAEGYYEWTAANGGPKTPYYLHRADNEVLSFAGLYELWPEPDIPDEDDPAKWVWTCTILTRPAPEPLAYIHDRTPVILSEGMVCDWLDPAITGKAEVRGMVDAIPDPELAAHVVDRRVGRPSSNDPRLIEAVR
ncbi:putative SOS response-associated peptidase YedK [Nocardiopsis mwathae]|uniref:Abasic site processing protein n=1 Tax=Nocardiopsis mwathae TaxID=1472723 RepID=A0A7W9YHC6_9ACTN|nr:SOS response-associated peptidase [Nocardiopsis mwathae]MBB6172152.1 putative SOS response-associated peptidase YedK [Nocardiopsis mwathae]